MESSGERAAQRPHTTVEIAYTWFLRLMAIVSMMSGLSYWAQLTGLGSDSLPRFDELPLHWQFPWVVLALLLPCASMGLWMLASWGVVLWVVASIMEIAIYGIWAGSYVSRPAVVVGHVAALAVITGLLITMGIQHYRNRVH